MSTRIFASPEKVAARKAVRDASNALQFSDLNDWRIDALVDRARELHEALERLQAIICAERGT